MSFRSFDLLNLVRDFGEDLTLRKVTTSGFDKEVKLINEAMTFLNHNVTTNAVKLTRVNSCSVISGSITWKLHVVEELISHQMGMIIKGTKL